MKIISIDGSERSVKPGPQSVIRVKRSEYNARIEHIEHDIRQVARDHARHEELPILRRLLANYKASGNAYLEPGIVKLEIMEGQ